MTVINANVDDKILRKFRGTINKSGLRKGDFKKALEEAMLDYIQRYSKLESSRKLAGIAKSISHDALADDRQEMMRALDDKEKMYSKLLGFGVRVDAVRKFNPNNEQLTGLIGGIEKLLTVRTST